MAVQAIERPGPHVKTAGLRRDRGAACPGVRQAARLGPRGGRRPGQLSSSFLQGVIAQTGRRLAAPGRTTHLSKVERSLQFSSSFPPWDGPYGSARPGRTSARRGYS